MGIYYLKGDATNPQGEGPKFICHICNDVGAWGAGFVLALSKKWKAPEYYYRLLDNVGYYLGQVQYTCVENDIEVVNMIAQHGCGSENGVPPIRYDALRTCFLKVNQEAIRSKATLHMPRIGCGLAGGKWEEIEKILNEIVTVDVYVYDIFTLN